MGDTIDDARSLQKFDGSMALTPLSPAEAIKRHEMLVAFIKSSMENGRDYGVIPGTEKRSLWKPGAEKLCTMFGFSVRIVPSEQELDWTGKDHDGEPFFYYEHRCEIRHGALLVVESYGSCNSFEKKYRYREGKRVCPKCGKEAIFRSKPRENDPPGKPMGWYCWNKKGGCGAQFAPDDKTITGQQVGQVKNDDIYDQVNTICKMAQKRAFVGSTVIACNASEFFSIDFDEEDYGKDALDTRPVIIGQNATEMKERNAEASAALYGDGGELVPEWAEPTITRPVEQPTSEQSKPTPETSAKVKAASLKYQPFVTWCNEWVKQDARAAKYAKEGGQANMFHILARVGKLGFAEITEANVEQVKAALACVSAA